MSDQDNGTRRTRAIVKACKGIQTDVLEKVSIRELVEAATALQDDLLLRAKLDPDGTKVVNVSHGRWLRFCAVLDAFEGSFS